MAGDQDAFASLFQCHEESLRRLIHLRLEARLMRRVDLSDVLQETRVAVLSRLAEFARKRPMPLAIWMRRTAIQQLADLHRFHVTADKRSVTRENHGDDHSSIKLAQTLRDHVTPSGILSAAEESRRVRAALKELQPADREILLMRYVEHYPNHEIAMLLDITRRAASKRHGMALLRLRRTFERLFPELGTP